MKLLGVFLLISFSTICFAAPKDPQWFGFENSEYNGTVFRRLKRKSGVMFAPKGHECFVPQLLTPPLRRNFQLTDDKFSVYLHAYGIPILPFGEPNIAAMERACYVLKFMLADNADIRNYMFTNKVRFVLINKNEDRESIPGIILPRDYPETEVTYGRMRSAFVVFTEDYVLCESTGGRATKDFMQVVSQAMLKYAITEVKTSFKTDLRKAFHTASRQNTLRGEYAEYDYKEYYSEGVLAYFNRDSVGRLGPRIRNTTSKTRENLKLVDMTLYKMIQFVHPCKNSNYIDRCSAIGAALNQQFPTNCVYSEVPKCSDKTSHNCTAYKELGYCEHSRQFSNHYCRLTCEYCTVQDEESTEHEMIPVERDCYDADDAAEWCNEIVEEGNCQEQFHYGWAAENCRASCQFCRLI